MKIKFLGTAAAEGIPALYCQCGVCKQAWEKGGKNIRTRCQTLINDELLIDFGPDTYKHVLEHKVPIDIIHHIIITHKHADHFYHNDLLYRRPGYAAKVDQGPLNVYGTQPTFDKVDEMVKRENMSDYLQAHLIKPFETFKVLDYVITPLPANHDQRAGAVIYLIQKENQTILYAHDTGNFEPETWEYLSKLDVKLDLISLDCTASFKTNWNWGHLSFDCFLQVIDKLKELGLVNEKTTIVANHFSHNGGASYDDMVQEAKKYNVLVSYDGMEVNI